MTTSGPGSFRALSVNEIAAIISAASDQWGSIHCKGWNGPILKLFPSLDHFTAHKILEAINHVTPGTGGAA